MYEAFFGFSRRPFATTPDARCFFETSGLRDILTQFDDALAGRQGICVLTGAPGSGKSLLCRKFLDGLAQDTARVLLTHCNFPTRRGLLQAILHELDAPYSHLGEQELRLELTSLLKAMEAHRRPLVLVCDEADSLSETLLEELRVLAEISLDGIPLIQLVLCGQFELEEKLAKPELQALNQRVGVHAYLDPLSRRESLDYLAFRVRQADATIDDVFTTEATDLIARAADGVPRAINQLADHALLLSFVGEQIPAGEQFVREALEDLQHLPLHWNIPAPSVESLFDSPETLLEDAWTADAVADESAEGIHEVPSDVEDTEPSDSTDLSATDLSATDATAEVAADGDASEGSEPIAYEFDFDDEAKPDESEQIVAADVAESSGDSEPSDETSHDVTSPEVEQCDTAESPTTIDPESVLAAIEIDFGDVADATSRRHEVHEEPPSDPEMQVIEFGEDGLPTPVTFSHRDSPVVEHDSEPAAAPASVEPANVASDVDERRLQADQTGPVSTAELTTDGICYEDAVMTTTESTGDGAFGADGHEQVTTWATRQVIDASEEVVVYDRYAMIDAGLDVTICGDTAAAPAAVAVNRRLPASVAAVQQHADPVTLDPMASADTEVEIPETAAVADVEVDGDVTTSSPVSVANDDEPAEVVSATEDEPTEDESTAGSVTQFSMDNSEELHWLINTRLQFVEEDVTTESTSSPEDALLEATSEMCRETSAYIAGHTVEPTFPTAPAEEAIDEDDAYWTAEEDSAESVDDGSIDEAISEFSDATDSATEFDGPVSSDVDGPAAEVTGSQPLASPAVEHTAPDHQHVRTALRDEPTTEASPPLKPHARPSRRFSNLFTRLREIRHERT